MNQFDPRIYKSSRLSLREKKKHTGTHVECTWIPSQKHCVRQLQHYRCGLLLRSAPRVPVGSCEPTGSAHPPKHPPPTYTHTHMNGGGPSGGVHQIDRYVSFSATTASAWHCARSVPHMNRQSYRAIMLSIPIRANFTLS